MDSKTSQRAFGPDLIRALAIVLVLASHTVPGGTMVPVFGVVRYYMGFLGVEIFFLLSGFLIGGILMEELFSGQMDSISGAASFWKRRWFRTLPNFYLFLIINLLLWMAMFGQSPFKGASYFWFSEALFWPHPDFFAGAWSLAIEEWFYLLFPLTLFVLYRLLNKRQPALVSTIIIFLVAPVILRIFIIPPSANWDAGVRRVTIPRLDTIGYGVILAFAKNYYVGAWRFLVKLWPIGAIATLGIFVQFCHGVMAHGYFGADTVWYRAFYLCLFSLSLALVFPKVAEMTQPSGWKKVIVQKLSLWSYSIYLCHTPIIGVIDIVLKAIDATYNESHMIRGVMVWLITIPTSALLYKFYEKPLMNLRDRPIKSLFRKPQWLTARQGQGEKPQT